MLVRTSTSDVPLRIIFSASSNASLDIDDEDGADELSSAMNVSDASASRIATL
jgi:hypothetical protein